MEFVIKDIVRIMLWYVTIWGVPATIVAHIISNGSLRHIIYLDKQLAKDLDKLYDSRGNMRTTLNTTIGCRYMGYCISYPFIRHRTTTTSIKFRTFMWVNAIGSWCFCLLFFMAFIIKGLDFF
jgi:hypothetical protein